MPIGVFLILLLLLLVISLPVGGVFGLMSMLPNLFGSLNYAPEDVVRAMFSGMNSFTLLAVPLFMVSGMIMAEGGLSKRLFDFFAYFIGNKRAGFQSFASALVAAATIPIGVTEIRLLIIGMPYSNSIASPTATKLAAFVIIFR